ncbi:MAG: GAF domain-containing protein, partial [Deltaproteobacteria bacterium]|nr:GAF domain-containing protein [Deltaproteobacteria bacterium]
MDQLHTLVSIATNLTTALSSEERFNRLLDALGKIIPYDAAALLRLDGDELVPVVATGLSADALGRRFSLREHPRLEIISRSDAPVFFPGESDLPDPYDGMLSSDHGAFTRIHACMGCALRNGDELLGVLTADAAKANAFEHIDPAFLSAVSALAAAEMRTTLLIQALEKGAMRQGQLAKVLMRDAALRQGSDMIGTTAVMQRLRQDI